MIWQRNDLITGDYTDITNVVAIALLVAAYFIFKEML